MIQLGMLILAASVVVGEAPANYARPVLLMDAGTLSTEREKFRILDVRSEKAYNAGHVPGALRVDGSEWAKAFATQQDPREWSMRIGGLGIRKGQAVVIYDDAMAKNSARIWWILRYWGVEDARLLNGGWDAWKTGKYAVSKDTTKLQPTVFHARHDEKRLADKASVLDIIGKKKPAVQIIDTRSEKEHCGDVKLAKKGGAIPGAMHLEWTDALDKNSGKFKSAGELLAIFKKAGIDLTRPTVTHCQSGGRASVMAFTLELMGADDVSNYYQGWSEWGNDPKAPVARPKKSN